MKKKVFAVLLSVAMTVSLISGCGTNKEKSDNNDTVVGTEGASSDSTQLTVWGWDASFNGKSFEEADKLDNKVTVDFVEMSKADCLKKINTILASGVTDDLPDIVVISDAAAQGYLLSYPDAFYAMGDTLNYNEFAGYKKDYVSYEGKSYGVPFDTGVAGLFYRTDYIADAGYTDEDMQNLTWDQYRKLGEKLKESGHYLQTYNPNDISDFQIMLQSCGQWYTDASGKADFTNNGALKECFRIFKGFHDSDYVKTVSDWTEFAGALNGGDVACVIRGSWITSTIKAAEDQSGLWKLAPIPMMSQNGATNKSNQGGSSFYVLSKSAHAKEAAQFLADTFGGSKELYNTLAKEANIMGTYLPAADVAAYSEEDEFFSGQKINQTLSSWIADIPTVNPGTYTSEAQAALLAVTPDILNGGDLDTSLQRAEDQFNQTIQE